MELNPFHASLTSELETVADGEMAFLAELCL